LAEQVDIDDLWENEEFTFVRTYKKGQEEVEDKIECTILGIRKRPGQVGAECEREEDGIRWVKVEGADYRLTKDEILDWLEVWGEAIGDIKEDLHEDTIDPDSNTEPLGNGNYSVKMKLREFPPQHVPMCGRRIRLYYKGIIKKCGKCFGNHRNNECDQQRVPWINYVRDFMEDHPDVPDTYYGRWARILKEEIASGTMSKTTKINTRRPLNWWEEEEAEETDKQKENQTMAEETDKELSENKGECEKTCSQEQIQHSQRMCQLSGMPEETIEMLDVLKKVQNKSQKKGDINTRRKQHDTNPDEQETTRDQRRELRLENRRTETEQHEVTTEIGKTKMKKMPSGKKGKNYL
jgi:hypothetical protein